MTKLVLISYFLNNITTFGNIIRSFRLEKKLTIKKVAAPLDNDLSTLSQIERDERSANNNMAHKPAELLTTDCNELLIIFLSDKVASNLVKEDSLNKMLQAAKQRLKHYKSKDRIR